MKSRWVSIIGLSTIVTLSSFSASAQNTGLKLMCQKFESKVKARATEIQRSEQKDLSRQLQQIGQENDASQLAYLLVTTFNMTPHNSAYVAQGLCTMKKGSISH